MVPLGIIYTLVTTVLQSVRMMKRLTILEGLKSFIISLLVIGFVLIGLGITGVVYGYVLATLLSSTIGLLIYFKLHRQLGDTLPSLQEVLQLIGDQLLLNIELTNYKSPSDGLVYEIEKLINEHGLRDNILFSSFYPSNLKLAQKLMPDIPCGLLTFPRILGKISMKLSNPRSYQALHPNIADVSEQLVSKVHSQGKRIHVWTVNKETEMDKMLKLGVDGIFTDDPQKLRSLLEISG